MAKFNSIFIFSKKFIENDSPHSSIMIALTHPLTFISSETSLQLEYIQQSLLGGLTEEFTANAFSTNINHSTRVKVSFNDINGNAATATSFINNKKQSIKLSLQYIDNAKEVIIDKDNNVQAIARLLDVSEFIYKYVLVCPRKYALCPFNEDILEKLILDVYKVTYLTKKDVLMEKENKLELLLKKHHEIQINLNSWSQKLKDCYDREKNLAKFNSTSLLNLEIELKGLMKEDRHLEDDMLFLKDKSFKLGCIMEENNYKMSLINERNNCIKFVLQEYDYRFCTTDFEIQYEQMKFLHMNEKKRLIKKQAKCLNEEECIEKELYDIQEKLICVRSEKNAKVEELKIIQNQLDFHEGVNVNNDDVSIQCDSSSKIIRSNHIPTSKENCMKVLNENESKLLHLEKNTALSFHDIQNDIMRKVLKEIKDPAINKIEAEKCSNEKIRILTNQIISKEKQFALMQSILLSAEEKITEMRNICLEGEQNIGLFCKLDEFEFTVSAIQVVLKQLQTCFSYIDAIGMINMELRNKYNIINKCVCIIGNNISINLSHIDKIRNLIKANLPSVPDLDTITNQLKCYENQLAKLLKLYSVHTKVKESKIILEEKNKIISELNRRVQVLLTDLSQLHIINQEACMPTTLNSKDIPKSRKQINLLEREIACKELELALLQTELLSLEKSLELTENITKARQSRVAQIYNPDDFVQTLNDIRAKVIKLRRNYAYVIINKKISEALDNAECLENVIDNHVLIELNHLDNISADTKEKLQNLPHLNTTVKQLQYYEILHTKLIELYSVYTKVKEAEVLIIEKQKSNAELKQKCGKLQQTISELHKTIKYVKMCQDCTWTRMPASLNTKYDSAGRTLDVGSFKHKIQSLKENNCQLKHYICNFQDANLVKHNQNDLNQKVLVLQKENEELKLMLKSLKLKCSTTTDKLKIVKQNNALQLAKAQSSVNKRKRYIMYIKILNNKIKLLETKTKTSTTNRISIDIDNFNHNMQNSIKRRSIFFNKTNNLLETLKLGKGDDEGNNSQKVNIKNEQKALQNQINLNNMELTNVSESISVLQKEIEDHKQQSKIEHVKFFNSDHLNFTDFLKYLNSKLKKLWKSVYKNSDIEYIEIVCNKNNIPLTNDSANGFIIMQKIGGMLIVMKDSCTESQKALASILIRIALYELYIVKCGMLVLFEPTYNLPIECNAGLSQIIAQLIIDYEDRCQIQVLSTDNHFNSSLRKPAIRKVFKKYCV